MKTRILIALLGLCLAVSMKAQSSLGIDTVGYSYTTPTYFNNTDLYSVKIINYGPQPYSGGFTVWYAVDSSGTGNGPLTMVDSSTIANVTLSTFGPGVPDSVYIIITPGVYRSGINTVVIWPRMSGSGTFTTHDSLKVNVLVLGYAGIKNIDVHLKSTIFPNPAQQELFLTHPAFAIEQVRIFDAGGKLLTAEKFRGKINVSSLSNGTYVLEVQSAEGKTERYRFIKE